MGRFTIFTAVALLVLGGCAGPRMLASDGGEQPLRLVAEMPEAARMAQPASHLLLVSDLDSDGLGAPPVTFPEMGTYPTAPALGTALAAAEDDPSEEAPAAPGEPTELAPAEAAADESVMKPNTTAEAEAVVEIAPPPPVSVDAARLGCCGPCESECCDACDKRSCDPLACGGYAGINVSALPGMGWGVEFGIDWKATRDLKWSWELGMTYQDLSAFVDTEKFSGKMTQARLGMRWQFNPCCKGHLTARAGIHWFHAGGDPASVDTAEIPSIGDYLGGYVGIGYEWDFGRRWSTGPEAAFFAAVNVRNGDFSYMPMVLWHLNYRF